LYPGNVKVKVFPVKAKKAQRALHVYLLLL
jgi:hypothetical protein